MTRRVRTAIAATTLLLATACVNSDALLLRLPTCDARGNRTLFLMAQSVPEASLVPCVVPGGTPSSWSLTEIDVDSGGSRIAFVVNMTADIPERVEVRLRDRCATEDARAVISNVHGAQQFDRVLARDPVLVLERTYVFDGGCIVHHVEAHGRRSSLVADVARAFSVRTSAEIVDSHSHVVLGATRRPPPGASQRGNVFDGRGPEGI